MEDNKLQQDPISRLYNNIKNDYDLPDFNTFKADMSDSTKASKLHSALVKDGYEMPSFDVFSVDMGLKKKAANLQSSGIPSRLPSEPNFLQQGQKVASGEIFTDISKSVPKTTLKEAAIKDKNNNNSYLGAMWNNVVASAERLAGGATRLAQKFDTSPVSRIQEAVDKAASSVTGVNYEALREKEIADKVKSFIGKARTSASSKEYEQGLAQGFDITNGIGLDDLKGLGAVLPSMLADIAIAAPTGGSTFAIQGYDDALSIIDNTPEAKNMSETTRTAFGFGGAIIAGVLEKIGMNSILKSGTATKYVTAKILKEAAEELAKKGVKVTAEQFEKSVANKATQMLTRTALKNTVKAGARSSFVEGATEATQEGAMDLMKLAANQLESKKIFDEEELKNTAASRYLNAAAMGGILGGGLGGGLNYISSRAKNVQQHIENEVKNAKTQEDIAAIINDINENLKDGTISENDAEVFKSMVDENISKPVSLEIENEKEIKLSEVNEKINSLNKEDRLYNDNLNKLNKERDEIVSYYDNLSKESQKDEETSFDDGKVPIEEEIITEEVTPTEVKVTEEVKPTSLEDEYNSKSVDELIALKKKLYPEPDIETPMTPEEKLLDRVIAKKFSEKNQEIIEKRKAAAEKVKPTEVKEVAKDLVEGESVTFRTQDGDKITGEKVILPGYEDMDMILVKDGFENKIYELSSGLEIGGTQEAFSKEAAIKSLRKTLEERNITSGKVHNVIFKGEKVKQINPSKKFESYAEERRSREKADYEKLPLKYSPEEIKKLEELKKKSIEFGIDRKTKEIGDAILSRSRGEKFKAPIEYYEKLLQKDIDEKIKKEYEAKKEPYPKEYIEQIPEPTNETIKRNVNQSFKKDKYEKIPDDVKKIMLEGYKKNVDILNKYGYYPYEQSDAFFTNLLRFMGTLGSRENRESKLIEARKKLISSLEEVRKIHEKEFGKAKQEEKAKEEKTFAQKDLDRAEAKRIHSRVAEMDPPSDAEQVALRYLSEGGKVSQDAINEVSGTTKRASLNTGRRELKTEEAKVRDYAGGKESLDDLAHRLWEASGQEISERDIKDALMSEIGNNNTRLDASKAYLERYNIEYQEEQYYERFIEEREEQHAKAQEELERDLRKPLEEEIEGMSSEEHINNLIKQYEAETKRENKQIGTEGKGEAVEEISSRDTGKKAPEEAELAKEYKEAVSKVSKKAKENAKKDFVDRNFDNLVEKLKIQIKCPT
tara:strand:+ start:7337 stop:11026 length:3690 start_codon:yes stop_codon:yes gene_type:complete